MPSLNFVKSTDDYQPQASPHSATQRKLSLLFFFLGLAISIASCAGYSIDYIPTTYQFGLIQMLPPLFWIGFALCLFSLLEGINRDTERVFFVKAFLLSMLIWNITTLVLQYPYSLGSYMHIFEATPIMLTGHVPPASEALSWVFKEYPASFPGYFILLSSIFQITNIAPLEFARYYPLFSSAITFLAIWLFFKTFLPSKNYRWALLIAMLANIYFQLHVSPQSAGFFAGLLILVALEKADWRWKVTATLLFAYVTISHPTTAFIVLPAAGLAWLFRLLLVRNKKILLEPVPFFVIGWIAWVMLFAVAFWERLAGLEVTASTVPGVLAVSSAPDVPTVLAAGIPAVDIIIAEVWRQLSGAFSWAARIRFVVLGVFALGSVYYLARQRLNNANHNQRLLITYTAFLIAPVVMTLIDITFLRTGQHLYDRYLLFFLLVAPILLVKLGEGIRPAIKKKAFFIVLAMVALLNLSTAFYQSARFTYSNQTFAASEFVNSNTSCRVIGGCLFFDLADPDRSAILRQYQFRSLYPDPIHSRSGQSIIVFDDHGRASYEIYYGIAKYELYTQEVDRTDNFRLVYSSKRYTIYWFPGDGG
jgi:hypothetical protein